MIRIKVCMRCAAFLHQQEDCRLSAPIYRETTAGGMACGERHIYITKISISISPIGTVGLYMTSGQPYTLQYRASIKWIFVAPDVSTFNQLVEEVVVTATLECQTLGLCGSDTVLFGLSNMLNLNRKQGHEDISKLFLNKLTFRFTMFYQYLTSKQ